MTKTVTNELILEHLKNIQVRLTNLEHGQKDIHADLRSMKSHIAALVQSDLTRDSREANVIERVERIERRLELTD